MLFAAIQGLSGKVCIMKGLGIFKGCQSMMAWFHTGCRYQNHLSKREDEMPNKYKYIVYPGEIYEYLGLIPLTPRYDGDYSKTKQ
jgi:hypothetical protein